MALATGDFGTIATRVLNKFTADTGSGGLYEAIGSWPATHGGATRRSVNTIDVEARGDTAQYTDTELPAVIILFDSTEDESAEPNYPTNFYKRFNFRAIALVRDLDEEVADTEASKIAHRIEQLVREQNDTDNQFGIVAGDVDGMEAGAAVMADVTGTELIRQDETDDKSIGRHAAAIVTFRVSVACSFTYT